ncbi:hypothetical protein CVT26_001885 [Gymnopilus dilepis]|uniref:HMG box domain-containing protein n=1 Tax=Gymnopilus dilepis TaxID=231916 RepID=A0A409Y3Y5_9AGAR|nr:hypothetical protein CVT26_001885 [Gymnopilus dilepis]
MSGSLDNSTQTKTSIRVDVWPSLQPLKGHCAFQLPEPTYHPPDRSKKSHARKRPPGHVPRPRNAFILFRCDFVRQKKIPESVENDHRNISRIVGKIWQQMSASQRRPWMRMAEMEKVRHMEKHPDFTFASGSRTSKRKDKEEQVSEPSSSSSSAEEVVVEIKEECSTGSGSPAQRNSADALRSTSPQDPPTFSYNPIRQSHEIVTSPASGDLNIVSGAYCDAFYGPGFDVPHLPIPEETHDSYRAYHESKTWPLKGKETVVSLCRFTCGLVLMFRALNEQMQTLRSTYDAHNFEGVIPYIPRSLLPAQSLQSEPISHHPPALTLPPYDGYHGGENSKDSLDLNGSYPSPSQDYSDDYRLPQGLTQQFPNLFQMFKEEH